MITIPFDLKLLLISGLEVLFTGMLYRLLFHSPIINGL